MEMTETINNALALDDFTLLFNSGVLKSAQVQIMVNEGVQEFVFKHHSRTIFKLKCKGRKNGMLKTYIYVDGKRREVLARDEEEMNQKLFKHYKETDEQSTTFGQTFEKLMDYKQKCLDCSSNTIADDRGRYKHISEEIKNTPLHLLSEEMIRRWIVSYLLTMKPKIKRDRLKRFLQLFSQVFEYGIIKHFCTYNPMKFISAREYYKKCDNTKKKDEEKAFSKEEIALLEADAQDKLGNPRVLMGLFSAETGIREGELASLHISDIHGDYIHVHTQQIKEENLDKNRKKKFIFKEVPYTKDERLHPHNGRYIPLTEKAKKVLELANKIEGESEYVFHDKGKSEMVTTDSYNLNLRKRCQRLGCGCTNNHAFRMAFNSRLLELGLSAAERALILGHEVQTNEAHYSLVDNRTLEDIKSKLTKREAL